VGTYVPRQKIESELAEAHLRVADLTRTADRERCKTDNLESLIDAIAGVQGHWRDALVSLKQDLVQDSAAESFAARIHTFATLLRGLNQDSYREIHKACRARYKFLPDKVIEQLTNADFLIEKLATFESAPVYAGAVIEMCKALETALNNALVETFVNHINYTQWAPLLINTTQRRGERVRLEVTWQRGPKHLSLGALALLCRSDDSAWIDFLDTRCLQIADWTRSELSEIITTVKDKFRNGCAHESSADRTRAVELREFLDSNRVFERLDSLACSFSHASRGEN
jgi:hypothetical protein